MSQTAERAAKKPAAVLKDTEFNWQDPLDLEGELTEEERMIRDSVRDFAQDKLMPRVLLAWREERLQAARFPRWQFDEHGRTLGGLTEVLECLNRDPHLDAWGKVLFFLQTRESLDDQRPLDLLRKGKVKEVCQAAQAYAE